MDLICAMWDQPKRGEITVTVLGVSRLCGCTISEAKKALEEIINTRVCNTNLSLPVKISAKGGENEYITITSRRMVREEKGRKKARIRVSKSRDKANVTVLLRNNSDSVTPLLQSSNATDDEMMRGLEDKKIEEDNTNTTTTEYYEKAKEYLLSTSVAHNIVFETEGLTAENYPGYVEQFISRQRKVCKTWPKFQEMQAHFCNWLDKKNLKPKTEKIMIR